MQRERGKLLHSFGTNVWKAKLVRAITRRPLSADRRKKQLDDVSGGLSTSGHESKSFFLTNKDLRLNFLICALVERRSFILRTYMLLFYPLWSLNCVVLYGVELVSFHIFLIYHFVKSCSACCHRHVGISKVWFHNALYFRKLSMV